MRKRAGDGMEGGEERGRGEDGWEGRGKGNWDRCVYLTSVHVVFIL